MATEPFHGSHTNDIGSTVSYVVNPQGTSTTVNLNIYQKGTAEGFASTATMVLSMDDVAEVAKMALQMRTDTIVGAAGTE